MSAPYTRLMDDETTPPAVASERDREYMRRWGEWKRESHEQARARHLALPMSERLVISAYITRQNQHLSTWALRDDDRPELFYERAKRLGLYRP
jgi:hypothetical protein